MKKSLILIIVFLLSFNIFADRTDDLRSKVEKIDSRIDNNRKKIQETKQNQSKILYKLNRINKEVDKVQGKYYKTVQKYKGLEKKIEYARRNIETIDKEVNKLTESFNKKIYQYYKYEYENRFDELFISSINMRKNFEFEDLKILLKKDNERVNNINMIKAQVSEVQQKIDSQKDDIKSIRQDLYKQKLNVDKKKSEQARIMDQLKKDEDAYRRVIENLKKEKYRVQKEIKDIINAQVKLQKDVNLKEAKLAVGKMSRPIKGKVVVAYGEEKIKGIRSTAVEYKASLGTRVSATAPGKVIYAGRLTNLGKAIIIDHGNSVVTIYGNLISLYVKKNERVVKNQNIGVLGFSSKRVPVLYYEVRFGAKSINPAMFY